MESPVVTVRMPAPLRDRIAERAEAERRSFSNQCRVLLEDALASDDPGARLAAELREHLGARDVGEAA